MPPNSLSAVFARSYGFVSLPHEGDRQPCSRCLREDKGPIFPPERAQGVD